MKDWSIEQARETYKIAAWGLGYFDINQTGNICVRSSQQAPHTIDLKRLVDELRRRKIHPPVLIRFMDILRDRVEYICEAFREAIQTNDYRAPYYPLYPIKVNQERDVVTSILGFGEEFGLGLEAGSKAELLIVMALTDNPNTPIVCNGYKDREFVELICIAHKMGKNIFPVIENLAELDTFIQVYKEMGIIPRLGLRIKLFTKGEGKWAKTGGDASKFGLRISEVMNVIRRLQEEELLEALELLHFHIGSQVTEMRVVKTAITETMRVFVEVYKQGAPLKYIDIGGGLGVDYDGSPGSDSSINYTIVEYASDVVYRVRQICDENGVPHPTIFSESGRFLAAHCSMLITNIAEVDRFKTTKPERLKQPKVEFGPIREMFEILDTMNDNNLVECYHDALQHRSAAHDLFNLGYLSLPDRAGMEELYWHIMGKILERSHQCEIQSLEFDELRDQMVDTYFANFSVFQSLPDSWAIKQIFPVIPIHRLRELPNRRGVIVDLTCDSDGLIENYLGEDGPAKSLPLHEVKPGEPYYVGIFLLGAYQETLGELHNLFGDTHAVQIKILGENQYQIVNVIKGDTIYDVMGYVSYNRRNLIDKMREQIESAMERELLSLDEGAGAMELFEEGVHGNTYFED